MAQKALCHDSGYSDNINWENIDVGDTNRKMMFNDNVEVPSNSISTIYLETIGKCGEIQVKCTWEVTVSYESQFNVVMSHFFLLYD